MEIIKFLKKEFLLENNKINLYKLRDIYLDKNPEILKKINILMPNDDILIKDKIRFILFNNCSNKCEVCNETELKKLGTYGNEYKCRKCVVKIRKEKFAKTNLERYGVEHASQNIEIKNKIKQTNLEKYGSDSPLSNEEIKNKIKRTNLERYGVDNPLSNEEIKNKIKRTNLERYGVEVSAKSENIKNKTKKTNLEKYGETSPTKSKKVKDKIKQTNLEKYGVDNPLSNEEIKNKIKQTNLEKYGVDNPLSNEEIKNKIKQTNLEKYGVEIAAKSENIKNKTKKTNLEKYGANSPLLNEEIKIKTKNTNLEKYGNEYYLSSDYRIKKCLEVSDDIFNIYKEPKELYKIYFNECNSNMTTLSEKLGIKLQTLSKYFQRNSLEVNYTHKISGAEKKFKDILNTFIGERVVIYNSREIIPPKELDIYFPDYNLAIEFCGAYWHSELFKEKNYHYNKWKLCQEKGILLLTFWDLEIEKRQNQIINFIKSKLGIFETRLYARNLEFKEIIDKQHSFFEDNHIQGGKCNIDRNFGLFNSKKELLGCVSYAHHHRDKEKYTLNRLAFKNGIQIVGGVGKLLSNSLKLIDRDVYTWSDNRYSNGDIYLKNGFDFDSDMKPDYSYYDSKNNVILSKQSQKKSNTGCPQNITEKEFSNKNGLYQLWDCGKKRFLYPKQ